MLMGQKCHFASLNELSLLDDIEFIMMKTGLYTFYLIYNNNITVREILFHRSFNIYTYISTTCTATESLVKGECKMRQCVL